MNGNHDDEKAIWQIGVFDAHCHPTSVNSSVKDIANMKARAFTVMATRSQDQHMAEDAARMYPIKSPQDVLEGTSRYVVPAFGWHPWFSHEMCNDLDGDHHPSAAEHYKSVLVPEPDNIKLIDSLPAPRSLRRFLEQTESRLKEFPFALVGEVGLDRSFRLPDAPSGDASSRPDNSDDEHTPGGRRGRPLTPHRVSIDHQKTVLRAQLDLAAKLRRPVSVHSVQSHGVVFELLQNMWKGHERPSKRVRERERKQNSSASDIQVADESESGNGNNALPFPPRICMHSYSGPPDALKQFLNPNIPADIYFSFSCVVNFSNPSSEKAINVIKAVPDDRILIESDLHRAGEKMDNLLRDIVLKVCEIKGWSLEEGTKRMKENWFKFIFG